MVPADIPWRKFATSQTPDHVKAILIDKAGQKIHLFHRPDSIIARGDGYTYKWAAFFEKYQPNFNGYRLWGTNCPFEFACLIAELQPYLEEPCPTT